MTTSGRLAQRERRIGRALVFGLALLAQLLLPAVVLRAQAIAAELCVTDSDGSGPGSKGHAHDQQCAHCRLHTCSPLTPPLGSSVVVDRGTGLAAGPHDVAFACVQARRVQPPPTGPPA